MTPAQNEWEVEAAHTALEAIKLTKHYGEFSERIYQGFKSTIATHSTALRAELAGKIRRLDKASGFYADAHDAFTDVLALIQLDTK